MLETHISQVLFTPDRVFKRLRPVDLGFVSFADQQDRGRTDEANHLVMALAQIPIPLRK